eukprot:JP447992.1.p3 GENE.JP447992.1~~JP447992.1.p3  ORF type:complete len:63 (-),score=4.46 JP447992.1:86-274(-)
MRKSFSHEEFVSQCKEAMNSDDHAMVLNCVLATLDFREFVLLMKREAGKARVASDSAQGMGF